MKNIRKIFRSDLYGLTHHFFALVIAAGLCLLPAFYAWFNIYANWDPYANTRNIRIAVVSQDEGCMDFENRKVNMGDEVLKQLREQTSIGWVFEKTKKDAVNRVKSGDCYAAVVIDKDFSDSMYHALEDDFTRPKITYYVNDKKNAVATKITDTAASKLQNTINQSFVRVAAEKLFVESNELENELDKGDPVGKFTEKLRKVHEELQDYDQMITTFIKGNDMLKSASDQTNEGLLKSREMIESGKQSMEDGKNDLKETSDSFLKFSENVSASLNEIQKSIDKINSDIEEAQLEQQVDKLSEDVSDVRADAADMVQKLDELEKFLQKVQGSSGALSNTIQTVQKVEKMMQDIADAEGAEEDAAYTKQRISDIRQSLSDYADTVEKMNNLFSAQISPQVVKMMENMQGTLDRTGKLLTNLNSTLDGMQDVFTGVDDTVGALNVSLGKLKKSLNRTDAKIEKVLDKLEKAADDQKLEIIMNLLAGNPETYSEFFSQPVKVQEHYVYEIKNYGSGVAPFYSVLAIWVGMTILVSILKVHVDKKDFPDAKPYEVFFGRYLLFLFLSEIQALVIAAGDLYLLGVQCRHPAAFYLSVMFTSFTFSILIYSLTISFGDVGKAFAVVIMVIQIAGSGGTYPIEALPPFFQSVYIFFPFPYAINAMRECIGGMYHQDLTIDLLRLMIFSAAALILGLVIRMPFIGLNHFIEKRMKDTGMM